MALYKKPPLEISFLSTVWVPVEVKVKFQLDTVTHVICHRSVAGDLSQMQISWVIVNQVGV